MHWIYVTIYFISSYRKIYLCTIWENMCHAIQWMISAYRFVFIWTIKYMQFDCKITIKNRKWFQWIYIAQTGGWYVDSIFFFCRPIWKCQSSVQLNFIGHQLQTKYRKEIAFDLCDSWTENRTRTQFNLTSIKNLSRQYHLLSHCQFGEKQLLWFVFVENYNDKR